MSAYFQNTELKKAALSELAASVKGKEKAKPRALCVFSILCRECCRLEGSDRGQRSFPWRGNIQGVNLGDKDHTKDGLGLESPQNQLFEHFRCFKPLKQAQDISNALFS